jgi:hypothetical protein
MAPALDAEADELVADGVVVHGDGIGLSRYVRRAMGRLFCIEGRIARLTSYGDTKAVTVETKRVTVKKLRFFCEELRGSWQRPARMLPQANGSRDKAQKAQECKQVGNQPTRAASESYRGTLREQRCDFRSLFLFC